MKKPIQQRVLLWISRFLQVQLFINTISLPILISWGLPISILSILGNLLFSPFLIVFLLLSSIIFFMEILSLPNIWIIYLLEKTTLLWSNMMSFGTGTQFLVGFCKPNGLFLILIPITACIIIWHKKTKTVYRSIIFLSILLTISFLYLKLICSPSNVLDNIEHNGKQVTIIKSNGITVLIDPGCIGRRISASSWVEYTLAPYFIKKTGKNSIDHLIVLQPGIITFNYIEKLCSIMSISRVYLPYWNGTLNKNGWRSFFFMKKALKKQNTKLIRIGKNQLKIILSNKNILKITPSDQQIKYHEATYHAMEVDYKIPNQTLNIKNSKYKTIT